MSENIQEAENQNKKSLIVELNDRLEYLVNYLFPLRSLLIILTSIFTITVAFLLAFYFRFELSFPAKESVALRAVLIVAIIVKLLVFQVFKLHNVMWRYVSIVDMVRIFLANLTASVILTLIVCFCHESYFPGFSRSVLFFDFLICFLMMTGKRVVLRMIREAATRASGEQSLRTILVGKIDNMDNLLQAFSTASSDRAIIGLICDDIKIGHTLRGIPVLGKVASAAKCAKKHFASEILLLPPYSNPNTIKTLMEELEEREHICELRMVPSYIDVADGSINVSHIREVEIEDLLGRQPVKLDRTDVAEFVKGKNVMITGAGGSIGSELSRQIAAYHPERLVLYELSEFNMYSIHQQLKKAYPQLEIICFIGDVRSEENVNRALSRNDIHIVYHAAAFKHVPLMEENPLMAFDNNVLGTANLAARCEENGVKRMVFISTDKAVCPTSVMGASKRVSERVLLERKAIGTEFVVVRFGNVLGSSGSVIPLFKQQINEGGPVTVTTKDMIRYFMSIPEAVDLVLQSGVIGHDRDIMVLEMGKPVRIYDMARKLIELSGLEPDKDIAIEFSGLRPGEKEYEELLTDEEKVLRTPFDRIYVARKEETHLAPVDLGKIKDLVSANQPKALRELVIEYIPENKFAVG